MNTLRLYRISPASPEPTGLNTSDHLAGLDLVRGVAAICVVLLHACVPYLRHPMPGLTWPVRDTTSEIVDWVFWSIELFVMPVFLVTAGFLLHTSLKSRGPWQTLQARLQRLGRPLLFGILVILPIDLYLWLAGWVCENKIPLVKLKSLKFDPGVDDGLWGLSHLWFLLYVITYVAIVAGGVALAKRKEGLATYLQRLSHPAIVLPCLAITAMVTLCIRPEVVWGFQHRFEPVPSKWIYSLMFFLAGMVWAKHDPKLQKLSLLATSQSIVLSIVAVLSAVLMGRWHLQARMANVEETRTALALLAGLTVTAATAVTLAGIAVSVKSTTRLPKSLRYLAAASFWIYLVHHPLLALIHLDLKWLLPTAPAILKALLSYLMAIAISLVTFEVWVHSTWFGRWSGMGVAMHKPVGPKISDGVGTDVIPVVVNEHGVVRRAA